MKSNPASRKKTRKPNVTASNLTCQREKWIEENLDILQFKVKEENENMALDSNSKQRACICHFSFFCLLFFLEGGKYDYARPQLSPPRFFCEIMIQVWSSLHPKHSGREFSHPRCLGHIFLWLRPGKTELLLL